MPLVTLSLTARKKELAAIRNNCIAPSDCKYQKSMFLAEEFTFSGWTVWAGKMHNEISPEHIFN